MARTVSVLSRDAVARGEMIVAPKRGWDIVASPLRSTIGYAFYNREPSFTLEVAAPHSPKEQSRFSSKLEDAVKKFRRHCPETDEHIANVVAIQVPISINFSVAAEWTRKWFEVAGSVLTSVLLYRAHVSYDNDGMAVLVHEWSALFNELGGAAVRAFGNVEIGFPIGRGSDKGMHSNLSTGQPKERLDREYLFFSGHHSYLFVCPNPLVNISLGFQSGIDTVYRFSGHAVISNGPHYRPAAPVHDSPLICNASPYPRNRG